jgi:hypothetical protein
MRCQEKTFIASAAARNQANFVEVRTAKKTNPKEAVPVKKSGIASFRLSGRFAPRLPGKNVLNFRSNTGHTRNAATNEVAPTKIRRPANTIDPMDKPFPSPGIEKTIGSRIVKE